MELDIQEKQRLQEMINKIKYTKKLIEQDKDIIKETVSQDEKYRMATEIVMNEEKNLRHSDLQGNLGTMHGYNVFGG